MIPDLKQKPEIKEMSDFISKAKKLPKSYEQVSAD